MHSSIMCGERYEMAEDFDPDWFCDAVTWSVGGEETYRISGRKAVTLGPAGVMCLAAGTRYAYEATSKTRFRSNMVAFPRWLTETGSCAWDAGPVGATRKRRLRTRLISPGTRALAAMATITGMCRRRDGTDQEYEEQMVLLYDELMLAQQSTDLESRRVDAAKQATRIEIAERIERARNHILENYRDSRISLRSIATEACLSKFHLVRLFRRVTGTTPMRYLADIRMNAAMMLLRQTTLDVAGVGLAVGYPDRTSFYRAFRRKFGAGPSAVR